VREAILASVQGNSPRGGRHQFWNHTTSRPSIYTSAAMKHIVLTNSR